MLTALLLFAAIVPKQPVPIEERPQFKGEHLRPYRQFMKDLRERYLTKHALKFGQFLQLSIQLEKTFRGQIEECDRGLERVRGGNQYWGETLDGLTRERERRIRALQETIQDRADYMHNLKLILRLKE